jgi:hypothetical protein
MTTPDKPPASAGESPQDFSLVLGGPLYQMFRRARLSGDTLELLRRRVVAACVIGWLPLLALTAWEGTAWHGAVRLPFLLDIDLHVRLLVAVPLLVLAELVVHMRMRPVVRQFLDRELIPDHSRPRFEAAIASAIRLRNSVAAEVLMIAIVYGVGVFFLWRRFIALDVGSWYGTLADGRLQPSLAGWWYGCVSLPVAQFLLLRWYFRIFVWARLLFQVSRIDLALVATHPDHVGGLGFLGNTVYAFTPLLLAQGALVSGMIANRIFYAGASLPQFRLDLVGVVVLVVFMVVGPLVVFAPTLERAKRVALREYGTLAQGYVRGFDRKWLRGGAGDEAFLGSADIQSLADLGNSFDIIREMRLIPFSYRNLVQLAAITLLPVLPLTLTMFSLEELVQRMLKVAF